MKRILTAVVFVAVLLAQANLSSGSGFLIYEHGAAAMAMAGAFVSVANDPSAIFHNPAGIAFLKGTQISVGTTLIMPSGEMTLLNPPPWEPSPDNWKQDSQTFYPSTFYITQSVGEKITLGFGFFTPYGLGASWPKENQLRYLGYKDDMKTFFFNPTIGVKLTENLSLGVGVSYVYSTVKFWLVELVDDFYPYTRSTYDVPAEMEGNGDSWCFNAGLLYRAEKFSVGFNWRSGFNIKYEGDITLDTSPIPVPFRAMVPTEDSGETTFKFPDIFGIGVSVTPIKPLLVSLDIHYINWSRFDKYVVTFDELPEMEMKENWKDSLLFRLGGQYTFSPKFCVRAGFLYDQTPQPVESMDPLLPDADRYAFTAGFGWKLAKNLVLDLTFHHEIFNDRKSPNRDIYKFGPLNFGETDYSLSAELLGLSLSFVF